MSAETYVRAVVPIGACFAGTLWLGNAAYLYLSVAFIQMLKVGPASCSLALAAACLLTRTQTAAGSAAGPRSCVLPPGCGLRLPGGNAVQRPCCWFWQLAVCRLHNLTLTYCRLPVCHSLLQALMPVAVFIVGCMLGTEQYERNTLANMIFVSIGVAIASYGAPIPVFV